LIPHPESLRDCGVSTIIYILNNDRANQKPVRSILLIMKKLKEDIIFEVLL
jgi:hypothetical protein